GITVISALLLPRMVVIPVNVMRSVDSNTMPRITLTGITTILGNKRALMTVQLPGKPTQSFALAEGERSGGIEVLEINEKIGSVRINRLGDQPDAVVKADVPTKLTSAETIRRAEE